MKSGDAVRYINSVGGEHNALVMNENILNEGVLDLVYVDADGKLQQVFGVVHESHSSKDDNNPNAERTVLNAWKENMPLPLVMDTEAPKDVLVAHPETAQKLEESGSFEKCDEEKPPVIQ